MMNRSPEHQLFGDAFGESPNITLILSMLKRLSPEERKTLFQTFGISNEADITDLILDDTGNPSTEEQLMNYSDYRVSRSLLLYVPPFLILIGTIGNILSFIILMRPAMRKYSAYIYLAVLSITDTLVLHIGLFPIWIETLTGFGLREQADWVCKATNVLSYTVSDYSVWLIIGVTSERFIATWFPLKAHSWCNRRRAVQGILLLLTILLGINAHFFWTTQIVHYENQQPLCDAGPNYQILVMHVWPWVDAFIYSFIPFFTILILNALIIRQVIKARKHRSVISSSIGPDGRRPVGHEKSTKLTVMLLTISFAFLITTLPMNISIISTASWNSQNLDMKAMAKYKLVRTVNELLMYVNHSMNFFLYCATGQKFRHQLCALMCRSCQKSSHNWASEHTNGTAGQAKWQNSIHLKHMGGQDYSKVKFTEVDQL